MERTYEPVVRNTCLREPHPPVSLPCPSIYKRPDEGDDVLPIGDSPSPLLYPARLLPLASVLGAAACAWRK